MTCSALPPKEECPSPQAVAACKKSLAAEIKKSIKESRFTKETLPLIDQDTKDRETDRDLRKLYAKWFICILIGQLGAMYAVIVFTGLKWFSLSEGVLNLYMTGTLAEIFGIVFVVTKYLFPNTTGKK